MAGGQHLQLVMLKEQMDEGQKRGAESRERVPGTLGGAGWSSSQLQVSRVSRCAASVHVPRMGR